MKRRKNQNEAVAYEAIEIIPVLQCVLLYIVMLANITDENQLQIYRSSIQSKGRLRRGTSLYFIYFNYKDLTINNQMIEQWRPGTRAPI